MKNKYYTPTLEELLSFIVNEKYCYAPVKPGRKLIKLDFKDAGFVNALKGFIESSDYDSEEGFSINPKLHRLKYLDKEDIESFEKLNETWEINNHDDHKYSIYTKELSGTESSGFEDWSLNLVFNGCIKNISELKIILKQIGLIK